MKVKPFHFPTVLGAVVLTYNVPGVTGDLNFTPEAVAGIFLGTVKKWNDPKIAAANPGVKLPAKDIEVVHRSDGSGTTFVFTDYLSKVSPDWKMKVGANTSVQLADRSRRQRATRAWRAWLSRRRTRSAMWN